MGVGLVVATLLIALMQGVFGGTWEVTVPRSIVAISGSCIRVPCSFNVPDVLEKDLLNCSGRSVWTKKDLSVVKQEIQEKDGQMTMTSLVTFIVSADQNNENVTCSVSYLLSKGGSTKPSATSMRLLVHYPPRFTKATLVTSAPIFEGCFVTFICSSDANPPPEFYWFRVVSGKQIEAKDENIYTDLKISNITSDYEQLQPRQPRTLPPPDDNYENLPKSPRKPKPAAAKVEPEGTDQGVSFSSKVV
ncbi:hypothetical protein GBF38_010737 [Nibea albiflora]|uniref:Uncharacterized protein n=1 Tax=Nibea albiflora TaxID=240163 RepID=A0ACB7ET14_NIBAL|nr:hypothetical protein GBF38_010737 [Nibea albiflora]